jgi:D-xylose 1-dehydrogenase (NADP+, D-xylono-1,5-lactone-forming)
MVFLEYHLEFQTEISNDGSYMQKIHWGILSTAHIAQQRLIPAIHNSDSGELHGVASRDLQKATRYAKENGIPRAYGSYEELLADPGIDAIYCPLPTGMHHDWCMKALKERKPVLCEKPITVYRKDAEKVFAAFEKADVLISEAYMYLFHPLNHKVRELVQSGRIGGLRSIQATFNVSTPRTDIRFNKELGGGALLDLGCYCIGISRFITGTEPVEVKSLSHIGGESHVDESFVGCLEFPGHVLGVFSCSLTTHFECNYEVYGSAGRIRVSRGGMIAWPGESFDIEVWSGEEFERISIPDTDHYKLLVEAFNQALLTGQKEVVAHQESLNNLDVMDRLRGIR